MPRVIEVGTEGGGKFNNRCKGNPFFLAFHSLAAFTHLQALHKEKKKKKNRNGGKIMDNDPFFVSAGAKKSKRWTPLASSGPKSKSKSKFKRNQHGKHGSSSSNRGAQAAKRAKQMRDEEIVSDESDNEGQGLSLEDEIRERFADDDEELSEDETLVNETAAEKRLPKDSMLSASGTSIVPTISFS